MRNTPTLGLAAIGLTLLSACDKGDPAPPPPAPASAAVEATLAAHPATQPGVFAVGDLLEVRIPGLSSDATASTSLFARVQADGTVTLPYLKVPVPLAGLDRQTATTAVGARYRSEGILANPYAEVRRLQVADTGGPRPGPIAPGDLVRCTVLSLTGPGQETAVVYRVDPAGDLPVPLVRPVHVAGLTDGRAAAAIAKAYVDAHILATAVVSVLTLEQSPADGAHLALPDGPVHPVPEPLRFLYVAR